VLAAQCRDPLHLGAAKDCTGRVVRAIDPDDARPRRDRTSKRVEVGMKTGLGPQGKRHHLRAARADDGLVGRVDRLADNDLVAWAGEALHRAIDTTLRPGHDRDIIGRAGLAAAPRDARRDRLAQGWVADCRGVMRAVAPQRRDGCLDDRFRWRLIGVADC
jgi:hypothetical protein